MQKFAIYFRNPEKPSKLKRVRAGSHGIAREPPCPRLGLALPNLILVNKDGKPKPELPLALSCGLRATRIRLRELPIYRG